MTRACRLGFINWKIKVEQQTAIMERMFLENLHTENTSSSIIETLEQDVKYVQS